MCMTTRTERVSEGVKRLRSLKLNRNIVKDYRHGIITVSERKNGITSTTALVGVARQAAAEFEKANNALVYHAIYNHTIFGDILTFLYVSADKECWGAERVRLSQHTPNAFLVNLNNQYGNEYSEVAINTTRTGLYRVA